MRSANVRNHLTNNTGTKRDESTDSRHLTYYCTFGVKPNKRKLTFSFFFFSRDQNERTPLHLAAIKGSLRCCETIVNKNEECVNDLDKNKVWPSEWTIF